MATDDVTTTVNRYAMQFFRVTHTHPRAAAFSLSDHKRVTCAVISRRVERRESETCLQHRTKTVSPLRSGCDACGGFAHIDGMCVRFFRFCLDRYVCFRCKQILAGTHESENERERESLSVHVVIKRFSLVGFCGKLLQTYIQ